MAHVYRLIVGVLLLWSGAAYAVVPLTPSHYEWGWVAMPSGAVQGYDSSPQVACQNGWAAQVAYYGGRLATPGPTATLTGGTAGAVPPNPVAYYCNGTLDGTFRNVYIPPRTTVAAGCQANSTAVSGGCQCVSPYVEDSTHTSCVMPPDPCVAIKGAIYGEIEWQSSTKGNNYGCLGGEGLLASCQTVAVCDYTSQIPGQSGYTCRGNSYANGTRSTMCSGTGETPESPSKPPVPNSANPQQIPVAGQPAPARCPAGQAPGTFNGTSMCQPVGGDTQTSSPAPGTGSTTTNNSDGSSTTSTTAGRTTCLQGQCTTSITNSSTTINAAGNTTCPAGQTSGTTTVGGVSRTTCTGTSSSTGTQAQTEFCKNNPKDKQCGGDGADTTFGGTCAAGFKAVSDDAVLNAMAEEQYRRNCQVFDTTGEASQSFATEAAKTGDQTTNLAGNTTQDLSGGADMTDALGGGSCPGDQTIPINVAGRSFSFVLAVSKTCQGLEWLGVALVAATAIACAFIVFKD